MKKDETHKEQTQNEASIGRRRLLKALTAGTAGGAAAALIPGEWKKPIINSTITPAHAQASPPVGAQDCTIHDRDTRANTNTSWRADVDSQAAFACGGSAVVNIVSGGATIGSCQAKSEGSGSATSWSCSASASAGLSEGDVVTYIVTWENGCTCSVTDIVV